MIPHSRPTLGEEEKRALLRVLESEQIAQGEEVRNFEKAMTRQTGRAHGVAVNSGTSALLLALHALGVTRGDEVVVPSYNCAALFHAIDGVEALPRLADTDSSDPSAAYAAVKKALTPQTRAVIVTHLFGKPCWNPDFERLPVPVIEDATQALGAVIGGRPAGSFGEISIFSFYATKMITTGEGGMILTGDAGLAEVCRDMRDYDKKESLRFRTNSKMTDFQAAMGTEQLSKLPGFVERRQRIAAVYNAALSGAGLALPDAPRGSEHVFYRYVVRLKAGLEAFLEALGLQGIDAKSPVHKPIHRMLGFPDSAFPVTTLAARECVSLPIFPLMGESEAARVAEAVRAALHGLKPAGVSEI